MNATTYDEELFETDPGEAGHSAEFPWVYVVKKTLWSDDSEFVLPFMHYRIWSPHDTEEDLVWAEDATGGDEGCHTGSEPLDYWLIDPTWDVALLEDPELLVN